MKHKVVRHGITTHFKEVCQSINGSNLEKNVVEIFAQKKWYEPEDHMKENMGDSNWSKGGFEMCALHMKNPLHS